MPGHWFALWLLAVDLRTQGMVGEVLFIGGGTVGGVGPDIASGVVLSINSDNNPPS
jgi:hypothetical protein